LFIEKKHLTDSGLYLIQRYKKNLNRLDKQIK
jgi:hypothetical protein